MMETEISDRGGWFRGKGLKVMLVILSTLAIFIGFLGYNTPEANASGVQDFSLYFRASEVATKFGTDMAPSTDEDSHDSSPWLNEHSIAGNVGGLLGYSRDLSEEEGGIVGWVTSRFSANSMSYNYEQLVTLGGSKSVATNPLLAYGLYGAQLQTLGLVDSGTPGFTGSVTGFIFAAIYWLSQLVPFIFNVIMKLLALLNPFQLFFGVFGLTQSLGVPFLSDLAATIGDIYGAIQNMSMVVTVPVLIGMTAVSIFMFQGNTSKKLLRVFVRVFMIFAGLPIIASTYTSVIEDLSAGMELGAPFANYVIATQYVDTENWMKHTRLAPPTTNKIGLGSTHYPGAEFSPSVSREAVLEINTKRVFGNDLLSDLSSISTVGESIDGIDSVNTGAQSRIGRDLIDRYRAGDRFSASDYEGYVKSQLDGSLTSSEIASMFEPSVSDFDDHDVYGEMFDPEVDRVVDFDNIGWSIYNMGGLHYVPGNTPGDGYFNAYMPSGGDSGVTGGGAVHATKASVSRGSIPIGLSPLSMYNFLNTDFGATSMTVYSPETSSNTFSSNDYASVSMANTGFFGFMFATESIVMLLGSAAIGLFYALGLLQIIVASIPRILSGVFGTAVGSLSMVTKLLVSTVVLILEIIGTVTLYTVFDGLLLSVMRGSDTMVAAVTGATGNPVLIAAGGLVKSAIVIVLGAGIVFFAMKNRTKFAKMVEEVTTDLITKLMSGLDNSMNQGNMFHDSQAAAAAGRQGTILGDDGGIGTQGSGSYAAAHAGGQDPKDGFSMKDAIQETIGQEDLKERAQGDSYEAPSKKDMAKAMASRYKDYKTADLKDSMAAGLGAVGTGLALAGVSDLDGGARDRIEETQKAERKNISDMDRGMGKYTPPVSSGSVYTGIDSIDDDATIPVGEEQLDQAHSALDGATANDIANQHTDTDGEIAKIENDGGETLAGQDVYGTASEASLIGTSVQTDEDIAADQAMVEAMAGQEDLVDMDNPHSHPEGIEPLTPEHDAYIKDLGQAVSAQTDSLEHHEKEARSLDAQAERLESSIMDMEAEGDLSPAQQQDLQEMKQEVKGIREKAEEHKKQARQADRKAQKLAAKQSSAQGIRQDAKDQFKNHQATPVQAAQAMVAAERTQKELTNTEKQLSRELNDMYQSGETQGVTQKEEELANVRKDLAEHKPKLQEARQNALNAMPQPTQEPLRSFTPEQAQEYMAENGLSQEQYQEQLAQTPTNDDVRKAHAKSAQVLGLMAGVTGSTPQETKEAQQAFIKGKVEDMYGKVPANAQEIPKRLAQASTQMETAAARIANVQERKQQMMDSNVAVDPVAIQNVDKELTQAANDYSQAEKEYDELAPQQAKLNERRAFMQALDKGQTMNNKRLDQIAQTAGHMPKSNARAQKIQKRHKNVHDSSGRSILPASAQVISGVNTSTNLDMKLARLSEMSADTPEKYEQAMSELNAGVLKKRQNVQRLEKQLAKMQESGSTNNVKRKEAERRIASERAGYQREVQKTQKQRSQLQRNAAGLFKNGVVPKNTRITGGKPIQGDIGVVTHAAENLSLILKRMEAMEVNGTENLQGKQKLVHTDLVNRANSLKKQLRSSNIAIGNMDTSQSAYTLAKALNREHTALTGETFKTDL